MSHPFYTNVCGNDCITADSGSRLDRVKEMNADQLRRVLAMGDDLQKSVRKAAESRLKKLISLIPRIQGKTYVMMREGDPWHCCNVTILNGSTSFKINGEEYFDCFLPKRWKKIASAQQNETRPVRRSELW